MVSFFNAKFMDLALEEAEKAFHSGEVPVGAVMVFEGGVVARGHNITKKEGNPLLHAEIVVLNQLFSGSFKGKDLKGCTLYVTVEPCVMCTSALLRARVDKVVFGAREPRFGGVFSVRALDGYGEFSPFEVVEGVRAKEAEELMKSFFRYRRRSGRDARVDEGGGLENR